MKKVVFLVFLTIILFFLGKDLNPFSPFMFTFHDETQPARIQQFIENLKNFKIPPRVAPQMNWQLGFPIFNFYAPTAYWLTSLIFFFNFDIIASLKISFLLTIIIGFLSSFLFFGLFFGFIESAVAAFLYISHLYYPLDIFVRGNLAEAWFLALFPLTLYFLFKNQKENKKLTFFLTTIFLFLIFTVHNILSLLSLPFILAFIFVLKEKKNNLKSLIYSLFLSLYFWLPLFLELKYTWAKEVAQITKYSDHFLCIRQLWQSFWGFGGSTYGCESDGMSFMIGKIQIILFFLGLTSFLFFKKKREKTISFFFLATTFFSIFLTLYQSSFLWNIFSPIFSFIQFPWRFISFSLLGISFFGVYWLDKIKNNLFKIFLAITIVFSLMIVNGKYFQGQKISNEEFNRRYLSKSYIEKEAAYYAAESLPKKIDYQLWQSFKKNNPDEKTLKSLSIEPFSKERQTPIQKIANLIFLLTFFSLSLKILLWKKR